MMNFATQYPGETLTVYISRAAAVTARMPTPQEEASGYPAGAPVLVVSAGGQDRVFPAWVELALDSPGGQPGPDQAREDTLYVLGVIADELASAASRIADLSSALRLPQPGVTRLAEDIRAEHEAQAAGTVTPAAAGVSLP